MGRGVSSGGGQSSLGYLFGSGEAPKPATNNAEAPQNQGQVGSSGPSQMSTAVAPPAVAPPAVAPPAGAPPAVINKQIPAGVQGNTTNNYFRADGQNTGNFITTGNPPGLPPSHAQFNRSAFNKGPCGAWWWVFPRLPVWGWQQLRPPGFNSSLRVLLYNGTCQVRMCGRLTTQLGYCIITSGCMHIIGSLGVENNIVALWFLVDKDIGKQRENRGM
ncbi:Protein SPIRAL1-like 1 [Vitis vinifera]|uniref:Protein SPIRAL1-like 1 n=1 Tax=Vitis vinifera TaxID=29760 RepID=A0A438DJE5_VITVI|nr:Protein SPIRAL1-like 1 [Vitis vinifera]